MKKIVSLVLVLLLNGILFSQQRLKETGEDAFLYLNNAANKDLGLDDIEGSPYLNASFLYAFIGEDKTKPQMLRYNAYKDEMEFKKGEEIFYLDKSKYSLITFEPLKKYVVSHYKYKDESINGYLVELEGGNFSLLKSERVNFVPERSVSRGLTESKTPAQFKIANPVFFIKLENGDVVEIPSSKNKFAKLFGSKEDVVLNYMKENKVSLSNENDLKKLVAHLNK